MHSWCRQFAGVPTHWWSRWNTNRWILTLNLEDYSYEVPDSEKSVCASYFFLSFRTTQPLSHRCWVCCEGSCWTWISLIRHLPGVKVEFWELLTLTQEEDGPALWVLKWSQYNKAKPTWWACTAGISSLPRDQVILKVTEGWSKFTFTEFTPILPT